MSSGQEPTRSFSHNTIAPQPDPPTQPVFAPPGYTVLRVIGQGGFGIVYHARRLSDQREFAIKLLKLDQSQDKGIDRNRFLREAVVLCQLQHPKIVPFRELGLSGEVPYIVMDFVPTVAWKELTESLSTRRRILLATGIVVHCLEALNFAHGKGIVHRDIKPSNVLLERRDKTLVVRLADFGLAKNYYDAGNSGITSDQQVGGTIGYMAPELLDGFRFFKPVSDQYSMAATLYELITSRPPVRADRLNAIIAIRNNKYPAIETLVPEVPPGLAAWIHRGLATEPDNRFPSTEEMLTCLKHVQSQLR